MGLEHNRLSHEAEEIMLAQIRSGAAGWATDRLTTRTTRWQGMADWPKPDFAFADASTNASLAVEFKPPGQPKREYVTSLGQAITYLQDFEYSAIILPRHTEDGFPIADYMQDCLEATHSETLPVALFSYTKNLEDAADLTTHVNLRLRPTPLTRLPTGVGRKVFWSYWRDLSNFDALVLLRFLANGKRPDFDAAYKRFWREFMVKGRALTWEARPRRSKPLNAKSYNAERLNTRLSLQHIGLITKTGHLTDDGFNLMRTGEVYGADSAAFLDAMAQRVLIAGRHLDLMFWIADKQLGIPAESKQDARTFYVALDACLQRDGIIAAVPDGKGKPTFLRDEQKLWNKLNLLKKRENESYFHPGAGLVFDWRNIISDVQNT